ncbi:hypothetical protein RHGRI_028552 [Rhododendron griersonianum]|uniref:Uncharacterized protein n=1 Tax=Rhododendron griersonianum TaxID=479676 RepID=A0AAV6IGK7_9ERIC|nr:hypothetical protein RHGRI_028552 [Rhododendron griersonianum]
MAQSDPVKVLDVCRVAPMPQTPNSTAQTTLPLTFFDVLWLRFLPNQRLFFYEFPYPETTLIDTILPKLKHSLSAALQHYLPLAGNLTWPPDSGKPIIQYNEGDTVSLTVAESEANFYHLSGSIFREAEKFHHLVPSLPASKTTVPVLALQVTLFPDAGLSIGYAAHHAVFDGKSISMFMHSWASICRHGDDSTLATELTPFYDRTAINDPSDIEKAYLDGWLAHNGPNNRSLEIWDVKAPPDTMLGTFQLTQANIESIKNCLLKGAKELIPNYLSRLKEGGLVSIAGSPRFELYKTDFGWGRPSKVEMVSIDKSGAFCLSDSRDGNGGIEIGFPQLKQQKQQPEVAHQVFQNRGFLAASSKYYQSLFILGVLVMMFNMLKQQKQQPEVAHQVFQNRGFLAASSKYYQRYEYD